MTKTEFLNKLDKLLPDGAIIMTRDELNQQRQTTIDQQARIKELLVQIMEELQSWHTNK